MDKEKLPGESKRVKIQGPRGPSAFEGGGGEELSEREKKEN